MPRFEPHPARRPAIVAGASSGIGAATAIELAAHGFPVALGARRVEKLPGDRRARSTPTAARRSALHLDVTDPNSVKIIRAPGHRRSSATSRCWSPARATPTSAACTKSHRRAFESQLQIHLIGANRLATAVLPGMVERQRGDLIFVGSDVALRQRPHMGAYGAAKAALVAMVTNLPDGTRRHRRASLDRAPRPDQDRRWAGACRPR